MRIPAVLIASMLVLITLPGCKHRGATCKQDNKDYVGARDLPPLKAPPATLGDADAACQRGDQSACEEASRVRAKALSGGASLPDPPPASAGGAPLKGGQPEQAPPGRPPR